MPQIVLGFFVPFVGTVLGAGLVFFLKSNMNEKFDQSLIGLAAGMMMSASIWSLILPAMQMTNQSLSLFWLPCTIGFCCGVLFLIVVEIVSIKFENSQKVKCKKKVSVFNNKKTGRMMLAITIHNIPEGLAVGVALAGAFYGDAVISLTSALTLAVGIGIQNFPDGAMVSLPLYADGYSKSKSFWLGVLSAVLELVSAIVAFFLTEIFNTILPFVLAFAGGTTIFVVVKDLVPSSQSGKYNLLATLAFVLGFLIMMILDMAIWFLKLICNHINFLKTFTGKFKKF